ncbi:restriction endonuclease [Streptomyces sp. DHE7-1]|nr:restriction endonuclease [Streptomyces sp. DHE7-1]
MRAPRHRDPGGGGRAGVRHAARPGPGHGGGSGRADGGGGDGRRGADRTGRSTERGRRARSGSHLPRQRAGRARWRGGDRPLGDVVDHAELDPDAFEQAIADLCVRDHCREVEVVGGAGDLGADVIGVTPDGRRVVIQCKRYCDSNKVGSQDMQRFGGTCYTVHEADVAVVVTTSDFTAPALEYAQQCGILCVNGEELSAWTDGTGPCPWDLVEPVA